MGLLGERKGKEWDKEKNGEKEIRCGCVDVYKAGSSHTKENTNRKKGCELEFSRCFHMNFTYARFKVTFFSKHFLISPILCERSTSINFGFFTKEDF